LKNPRVLTIRIIFTVLSVTAVAAIFYNSSLSAVDSSSQSGSLLDSINSFLHSLNINITLTDHFIRKTAHFTEYSILGILLTITVISYVRRIRPTLAIALPLGLIVSICDELIQLGSEGRSCEIADMALDFSAVIFAALTVTGILYLKRREKTKKEGNTNE